MQAARRIITPGAKPAAAFPGNVHFLKTTPALRASARKLAFNNIEVTEKHVRRVGSELLTDGQGVLRMGVPAWVRRDFCNPGMNLRLDPRDWFPFGLLKGGIDERWFACTIRADNPDNAWHEGLAMAMSQDSRVTVSLQLLVDALGAQLIGKKMYDKYGRLEFYTKFFDNKYRLPHHLHQGKRPGGPKPKAEAYWFDPCYNNHGSYEPDTGMGLNPGTTRAEIRRCLENWNEKHGNGILFHAAMHHMEIGTGFLMPTGVLHSPAGRCTFEPQELSDTFNMYQSLTTDGALAKALLMRDVPKDASIDFMLKLIDWKLNLDPHFYRNHLLRPILDKKRSDGGITDSWVVYGRFGRRQLFSAKRLVIPKGHKYQLNDQAVASVFFVNGRGKIGPHVVETPGILRINELVHDEFVVAHGATPVIENTGEADLICLRTFGPDAHEDMPFAFNE